MLLKKQYFLYFANIVFLFYFNRIYTRARARARARVCVCVCVYVCVYKIIF